MVRKRTRKYESDDNDSDSDVDFDVERPSRPAPKKYSLRERKAPLFTTDFDYYGLDDDEAEAKRPSSEDEDFQVEADVDVNGVRSYFEPDPEIDPQNADGLIDFEDIIRADIVVNRNRIDYDNLIQKTEIKLTQPKKRGRKPKIRPEANNVKQEVEAAESKVICEPELENFDQITREIEEVKEEENKEKNNESKLQDGLPNGGVIENGTDEKPSIEVVMLEPPPIEEAPDDDQKTVDEEDDDVIVLGELKQDVIVLDD